MPANASSNGNRGGWRIPPAGGLRARAPLRAAPARSCGLVLLALCCAFLPVAAAALTVRVEGRIDWADPALAPVVRNGLVLAGSLQWNPGEPPPAATPATTPLTVPLRAPKAAYTLDRNHVWITGAGERSADGVLTIQRGASGEAETDWIHLILPVAGADPAAPFEPHWWEIWLWNAGGRMLAGSAVPEDPTTLAWANGSFRLSFGLADGRVVAAEGLITIWADADAPADAPDRESELLGLVASLGARLNAAEDANTRLADDLTEARERIRGLHGTVDFLIAERHRLNEELLRIERETAPDPAPWLEQIAALEAERALFEEARAQLAAREQELVATVHAGIRERYELRERIEQLRSLLGASNRADTAAAAAPPPPTAAPDMVIIEQEPEVEVREEPVYLIQVEQPPTPPPQTGPASLRRSGRRIR
jgi:hypothetical protein